MKLGTVLFFGALFVASLVDAQKKVVCYWIAEMDSSQINPNICTHIIYSFLGLDSEGHLNYLWRTEFTALGLINQLVNLKLRNANLKIIVAVGGWNLNLVPAWKTMVGNVDSRNNFAQNVLDFLQKMNLDGIDWEYPNINEDTPNDINDFVALLQTLKQKLGSSYSVSVAMGAGEWRAGKSYDIPKIFDACDFVNVMSYDFSGSKPMTYHHSSLFSTSLDTTTTSVDNSVKFLLKKGVSKDKLIVGIPTYGHVYRLASASNNGNGAVAGAGETINYNLICPRVNSGSLTYRWDDARKVPYAFSGTFWVGYDDIRSVTEKANYINKMNLGGAMFWDLDMDDFSNSCGQGRSPLITTVSKILLGATPGNTQPAVTNPPVTNPPVTNPPVTNPPVTNPPSGGQFICPADGLFKHPTVCSKFYNCGNGIAYEMTCPDTLMFNVNTKNCDWPYNVVC